MSIASFCNISLSFNEIVSTLPFKKEGSDVNITEFGKGTSFILSVYDNKRNYILSYMTTKGTTSYYLYMTTNVTTSYYLYMTTKGTTSYYLYMTKKEPHHIVCI